MSDRFFLATPPADGRAELSGDEARHLARVLRAQVGDDIVVFDGAGQAWPARIATLARDRVGLDVGPALAADSGPCPLTLAVALPKGDRQKWMVEKLTELGCGRLVPLVTTRGVAEATPGALERLTRSAIEACKQCGRNTLLEISAPRGLADVIAEHDPATLRLVADPTGDALGAVLDTDARVRTVLALIGPEGGFTPEELAAAKTAGFVAVGLGRHILRVETAAVTIAAAMAAGNPDRAARASTAAHHASGPGKPG